MRKLVWTLALTMLTSQAVSARPILVESGQHDDFVRLVLYTGADRDVRFRTSGNVIEVTVPEQTDGFNTRRVFRRIDRSVVSSIEYSDDTLLVTLNCDCEAVENASYRSFWYVDILPGPALAAKPELPRAGATLPVLSDQSYLLPPTNGTDLDEVIRQDVFQKKVAERMERPVTTPEVALAEPEQPALEQIPDVSQLRRSLSNELGTAATKGILQKSENASQNPARAEGLDALTSSAGVLDSLNISLGESVDVTATAAEERLEEAPAVCSNSQVFDISSWPSTEDVSFDLANSRRDLFDANGDFDPKNAVGLVQTYIRYGLGAEALQTIEMIPEDVDELPILAMMAQVLNGETPEPSIDIPENCGDDAVLWSVLADDTRALDDEAQAQSIRRAFEKLPVHLREILGERLVFALERSGHSKASSGIKSTLARSGKELEKPEFHESPVDTADSKGGGGPPIESETEKTALRFINEVDRAWATRTELESEILEVVSSFRVELRNTELEPRLLTAEVRAMVLARDYVSAVEFWIDEIEGKRASNDLMQTKEDVFSELISKAGYIALAEIASENMAWLKANLSDDLALQFASRMIDAGFAPLAADLMPSENVGLDNERYRIANARLALANGSYGLALDFLSGLTGDEADQLRTKANRLAGGAEGLAAAEFSPSPPLAPSSDGGGPAGPTTVSSATASLSGSEDLRSTINDILGDDP